MTTYPFTGWLAMVGVAVAGCGGDDDASAEQLYEVRPVEDPPWAVTITAADFVAGVDNPFLPLPVGSTRRYEREDGREVIEIEVLAETREVWGVQATVVRDTVFADEELVEDTWDWFAQDVHGNVWYLGEETCEYVAGECVDMHGAWEAGEGGAIPGVVMLADPQVGDAYYQEYLADEAEDYGEVVALDGSADVPAGSFDGCVRTRDTTPLEPDIEEFKLYCPGVGVVLEEEENTRVELAEYDGLDG